MVSKKRTVIWDNEAKVYLKKAIAYIKKESPQNAEKVKKDIIASTQKLADEPERLYAPDKYRTNNDGSYRAYELHRFRISYFIGVETIRIVRVRHASMQPKQY